MLLVTDVLLPSTSSNRNSSSSSGPPGSMAAPRWSSTPRSSSSCSALAAAPVPGVGDCGVDFGDVEQAFAFAALPGDLGLPFSGCAPG